MQARGLQAPANDIMGASNVWAELGPAIRNGRLEGLALETNGLAFVTTGMAVT